MQTDRTTKLLLFAIASALWLNLLLPVLGTKPAEAMKPAGAANQAIKLPEVISVRVVGFGGVDAKSLIDDRGFENRITVKTDSLSLPGSRRSPCGKL